MNKSLKKYPRTVREIIKKKLYYLIKLSNKLEEIRNGNFEWNPNILLKINFKNINKSYSILCKKISKMR